MQKITPFLWFDTNAEEAARFYTSIFKDSRLGTMTYYGEGMPLPAGTIMTVAFELAGQEFVALNGGPQFKFSEAVSFVVNCETQKEIDYFWEKLSEGGEKSRCGWLQDKFGLWWQVEPVVMFKLLKDKDPQKVQRVMDAMMQMDKPDINRLQKAAAG
jgi:predicted 3-demethylubiquinone-9 3-methyltransferase (glyoxalase superfamily)